MECDRKLSRDIISMVIPTLSPLSEEMASNVTSNLHWLAVNNQVDQLRALTNQSDITSVKENCLVADESGNIPAMLAAQHNCQEALMALLAPFSIIDNLDDKYIHRLLHHQNNAGQNLLFLVVQHMDSLFSAHALLIEFEAVAHRQSTDGVHHCLRKHLGTGPGASASMAYLEKIKARKKSATERSRQNSKLFLKAFISIFLVKSFLYLLDVVTDIVLIIEYFYEWKTGDGTGSGVLFPGQIARPSRDSCMDLQQVANYTGFTLKNESSADLSLNCYSRYISKHQRFVGTLVITCLPFMFNLFEMWRFQTFSSWMSDRQSEKPNWILLPIKSLFYFILWLLWPFVAFFRYAFYQYKSEVGDQRAKSEAYSRKLDMSKLVSLRTHFIEVCTESTFQPLLQLYLVLISIYEWGNDPAQSRFFGDPDQWIRRLRELIELLTIDEVQRIISAAVSILTMAVSYTNQYNYRKNQVLTSTALLVYFGYVLLAIFSRILCFELLAFYLGPGRFSWALLALVCHVLLMATLHFLQTTFTMQEKEENTPAGGVLVFHNCLINGLANVYMHNELDMDFGHGGGSVPHPPKGTLYRQLCVDVIIFVENLIILVLAQYTPTSTETFMNSYWVICLIIVISYSVSIAFKVIFYLYLHPWSLLIKNSANAKFNQYCSQKFCTR